MMFLFVFVCMVVVVVVMGALTNVYVSRYHR